MTIYEESGNTEITERKQQMGWGFVKPHKAKGGACQKVIPHRAFNTLYIPLSVLSVTFVVNSHFPF